MTTEQIIVLVCGSSAGGGLVGMLLKWLVDLRKEKRADKQVDLKEANTVITRYVKELESLRAQHKQDYDELKREHRTCLEEGAEMREEIGRLRAQVELLTHQVAELKQK